MEDYMNFQLCIKVDNTISQISRKFGYIHLTIKQYYPKFNKIMDENFFTKPTYFEFGREIAKF